MMVEIVIMIMLIVSDGRWEYLSSILVNVVGMVVRILVNGVVWLIWLKFGGVVGLFVELMVGRGKCEKNCV